MLYDVVRVFEQTISLIEPSKLSSFIFGYLTFPQLCFHSLFIFYCCCYCCWCLFQAYGLKNFELKIGFSRNPLQQAQLMCVVLSFLITDDRTLFIFSLALMLSNIITGFCHFIIYTYIFKKKDKERYI